METALNSIGVVVYLLVGISVVSFVIGHVVVRRSLKSKGVSKRYIDLLASLVTLTCMIIGFTIFLFRT